MILTPHEMAIAKRGRNKPDPTVITLEERQRRVELLREALKTARMEQKAMAKCLGVSPASVCRWLSGYRAVPTKYVDSITGIAEGVE